MNRIFTALLFTAFSGTLFAQNAQETVLRHIEQSEATATPNLWGEILNGSPGWGYYIGHNPYGDEAFAEKYNISGTGKVLGVIAHFAGKTESSTQLSYKVYTENSSGLPGSTLAQKMFAFQDVPTDGSAYTIMFDNPVDVDEAFFVALDLGDYSHDPLQGDTLCLLSGEDGSRPSTDDTFGRNAIRWHGHGGEDWKDFFTQNFTPISTYFAIYPIMEGAVASVSGVFVDDVLPVVYPLPAQNDIRVDINLRDAREMAVRIFSLDGREVQTKVVQSNAGQSTIELNISDLANGSYILSLESGVYRHAQIITKN